MAVIDVEPTDPGRVTQHWRVPSDPALKNSPIPRGLRIYGGSTPIAALGAGDETNVDITLTFPEPFVYLPKSLSCQFLSDDVTTEFDNIGSLEYLNGTSQSLGQIAFYELLSSGASFRFALRAMTVWRPQGTWRQWLNGPDGASMHLLLTDMSGDASTAGDFSWTAEFWEYDVEQCLNWPINTPAPTVNYN